MLLFYIIINLALLDLSLCLPTKIPETTKVQAEIILPNTTKAKPVTFLQTATIKPEIQPKTTIKSEIFHPQFTKIKPVTLPPKTAVKPDLILLKTTIKPEILLPKTTTKYPVFLPKTTTFKPITVPPKTTVSKPVVLLHPGMSDEVPLAPLAPAAQAPGANTATTKAVGGVTTTKLTTRNPTTTEEPETEEELRHDKMIKVLRKQSEGNPDSESGRRVTGWRSSSKSNPEELGTYFEGDMLNIINSTLTTRQGLLDSAYRWPLGIVSYRLAPTFTLVEIQVIQSAMNEYHKNTCIKFLPYTGFERDYISIERENTGCWSTLGRVGGMQIVNLQSPGCLYYVGTVIHELMHTIGFFHEHSRLDRDNSVTINWPSVLPGQEPNFNKYNSTSFNLAYDYGSVMHYSQTAFSKDGTSTIIPVVPGVVIGQRKNLSPTDIAIIRTMYKCVGFLSFV